MLRLLSRIRSMLLKCRSYGVACGVVSSANTYVFPSSLCVVKRKSREDADLVSQYCVCSTVISLAYGTGQNRCRSSRLTMESSASCKMAGAAPAIVR